ncbi:hypothetical protein GCM10010436_82680 [Paractinoplanes durhamensis]
MPLDQRAHLERCPLAFRRDQPMSSEPLATTPIAEATDAASAEKGLLIVLLLLVVLGVTGMLFMS